MALPTAAFWLAKGLSTALGEAVSDWSVNAWVPELAVLLGFLGFTAALLFQLTRRRYTPWAYCARPVARCRRGWTSLGDLDRTHEPRRAERRFRAGRRPRQVWSWSGRYGGYQARDQRPPATFRAGGAATYRQVPGPHPRRAFRTHPTVLASALRWSGERHGDHEIAECAVAVTGDRPRSPALPTTRKG